ncbi:uncharacterized protein [Henckelia pumila]|uniref:uncharacterized protein isoform X2 n=1 Tax=Henckelia pumila TaxID=405737 RepID=UPI003C6DE51C
MNFISQETCFDFVRRELLHSNDKNLPTDNPSFQLKKRHKFKEIIKQKMSLVDYTSSSDEDETEKLQQRGGIPEKPPSMIDASSRQELNRKAESSTTSQMKSVSKTSESSELKLPDASFLLNSTSVPSNGLCASDHSTRVAAAMARSAARKRELNMLPADNPHSKFPKRSLPHSKNVPDTLGGRLLPPQLVGRSNVVTEDIKNFFVRRSTNSSIEPPA